MLKRILAAAIGLVALAAAPAVAQAPAQPASPDLQLWRLDCGDFEVSDIDVFSDAYHYSGRRYTLTDSCYLIRNGDRYLLWDTGVSAQLVGQSATSGPFTMTLRASLRDQLARISVRPEQVSFVGISHYHDDHTGQAADFPGATLLVGSGDWEAIRGRPASAARFRPWIEGGATAQALAGDHDVFGDGSVVILSLPGHTPGHQALLVRLPQTGAVLLSGDLYHLTDAVQNRSVPRFNTNRADTFASIDRFEAIRRNLRARVVIQHEPADIAKLPAFPDSAR
jgi:glyoxylase-like metal-dependent hydrolase (beta-lactamase superfamily II)